MHTYLLRSDPECRGFHSYLMDTLDKDIKILFRNQLTPPTATPSQSMGSAWKYISLESGLINPVRITSRKLDPYLSVFTKFSSLTRSRFRYCLSSEVEFEARNAVTFSTKSPSSCVLCLAGNLFIDFWDSTVSFLSSSLTFSSWRFPSIWFASAAKVHWQSA